MGSARRQWVDGQGQFLRRRCQLKREGAIQEYRYTPSKPYQYNQDHGKGSFALLIRYRSELDVPGFVPAIDELEEIELIRAIRPLVKRDGQPVAASPER
jgi:hypothetical protein